MKKENVVFEKSKSFALRVVRLYQFLCKEKKEFVLSKQVLRSGTSIGANIAESQCAVSDKEFLSKMYIAFKETAESAYWLELLFNAEYISDKQYQSLSGDCGELKNLLASITKSTREQIEIKSR